MQGAEEESQCWCLNPALEGPGASCLFVQECGSTGRGYLESSCDDFGCREWEQDEGKALEWLVSFTYRTSSQKLLPVYFKTDSLLKGDAGQRAWQASVCCKEGRRCVFQKRNWKKNIVLFTKTM